MHNFGWRKLQEKRVEHSSFSFWRGQYKVQKQTLARCFRAAPSSFSVLECALACMSLPVFLHTNIDSYISGCLYPEGIIHFSMAGVDSDVVRQITARDCKNPPVSGRETSALVVLGFVMQSLVGLTDVEFCSMRGGERS